MSYNSDGVIQAQTHVWEDTPNVEGKETNCVTRSGEAVIMRIRQGNERVTVYKYCMLYSRFIVVFHQHFACFSL